VSGSEAKNNLLQGSLDLLVLRTLLAGPHHGYAIARHLREVSQEFLQVEEGSLYPALHRLERRGWVEAHWGTSESNRRAKYYRLTAKGRKQLQAETTAWNKMSAAIERILNHRPAEA
jgi:transcriptional regulator